MKADELEAKLLAAMGIHSTDPYVGGALLEVVAADAIAALREAERDAARYRWLREHPPVWMKHEGDKAPGFGNDLDTAIDVAIAAEKTGEVK